MLRPLPWLLLFASALATLGSGLGIWSSHIERMSHFRLWWIGLLSGLLIFYLAKRRAYPAMISVALLVVAILPLLPYLGPAPATSSDHGPGDYKVIAWNLLHNNPGDRAAATQWLASQNADLILLTECTHEWQEILEPLHPLYPHRLSSQRDGSEGMLLLSKYPLDPPDPEGLRQAKPWISTVVHLPSGEVRIIGMHPRTPRSGHRFDERNLQYQQATRISAASELPVILLGDLNCTPFSPWFRYLLDQGKLEDSAMGRGLASTWSGQGIGLPIDHILLRGPWQVLDRDVHPDTMSSDHYPVIARLHLHVKP